MAVSCGHLDTIEYAELPGADPGLRGLPQDRRALAAPADVHELRPYRLL